MRRFLSVVMICICGCSTAPVADFLDVVRPAPAVQHPSSEAPQLPAFTPPPPLPTQPPAEPNAPPPPKW
ncbi:MAG: hypothetical protein U0746_13135 [Gemmataceae bacterium]